MPYPNEHAARWVEPSDCMDGKDDWGRQERDHDGKTYTAVRGRLKKSRTAGGRNYKAGDWIDQAFRYPKDIWMVETARSHAKAHENKDGHGKLLLFEPATEKEDKKEKIMKQGIFMRTMEAESEEQIIDVVGVIGWEVWYLAMHEMLRAIPETVKRVVFEIFSPGGDVWEGNAIVQDIGAMKQETIARVQVAASMATLIAVACDKREIAKNGRWLVHNPWTICQGDADAFEKRAQELRDCEKEAAKFYADRTGRTQKEMFELMEEERWLTPQEALELGFVQKINDPFDQAAFAEIRAEIEAAGKWPKALADIPLEEEKTDDADTTGAKSDETDKTVPSNQPSNESEDYKRGFMEGKAAEKTENIAEIAAVADNMTELKAKHDELDTLCRKMQGERDSARAEVEKSAKEIKLMTEKLTRLLSGGMNFSPFVETWAEALKACNNDYEEARKQFPDVYRAQREQDKVNRK